MVDILNLKVTIKKQQQKNNNKKTKQKNKQKTNDTAKDEKEEKSSKLFYWLYSFDSTAIPQIYIPVCLSDEKRLSCEERRVRL